MRILRIWLLVVFAVLLPVRGALAMAVLCPHASGGGTPGMAMSMHHGHSSHHEASSVAAAHHPAEPADAVPSASNMPDKCSLCASCCSLTPLWAGLPALLAPVELASVQFPDLSVSAPSFLAGGLDRPPRTL